MKTILLIFSIFIISVSSSIADEKPELKEEKTEEKKATKKLPIKITSDKMKYHENGFVVFFTGNVNVDDGEMKLNCDFMTVKLDKTRNPTLIICEKNVVIRKEGTTSNSDRAEYLVPEEKVTLTGNPKVVSTNAKGEKQTFTGSKIDFYRNSNVIEATGSTFEIPGAPAQKTEKKDKK